MTREKDLLPLHTKYLQPCPCMKTQRYKLFHKYVTIKYTIFQRKGRIFRKEQKIPIEKVKFATFLSRIYKKRISKRKSLPFYIYKEGDFCKAI